VGIVPGVLLLIRTLLTAFVQLLSPRVRLVAENLLLRQQLVIVQRAARRPRLKPWERRLLSALAVRWNALQDAILIVKPATLLRWHRAAWRWWWRRKSKRPPGRPSISPELRALIRRFWRESATWGQKVIASECGKLGWTISPRTVAKYRPRHLDRGRGQSWSTFLRNHLTQVWACDFFTIVSVRFRVLYAFVILSLERRNIVHVGVTEHPTAAWAAQRVVEAIGDRAPPRFLLHDRDMIYGGEFRRRVRRLGVRELVTPPRSPKANAYCERVVGTLRRDCLDHLLVWNERQAERLLREYVRYYDGRPHRGLSLQPPAGRNWLGPARPSQTAHVRGMPILGGLHHRYGTLPHLARLVG
jgi:transposase InsO family protein